MSVTLTYIGLDELKAALLRLPADLTARSERIVVAAAVDAAAEVRAAYPEGETGNLRKGVRVATATRGITLEHEFAVGRVVRSTAPHAMIFETGTKVRYTKTGAHRGFMPGANIFVPVMQRRRRAMLEDLVAVVEEAGLDVRR